MPRLAALAIPTLFPHGRHDLTFPVSVAQEAVDRIPSVGLGILEEAGHMAHGDQPDAWLAAVAAFLT
ncbi:alpha/beta fold hydrolase [Streptomyces laurentii]|uniref:alpha/beta fold hydrolase n=1 Tax=Streptomyces laurentii TaxID=39478 RepID=UPI00368D1E38